MIKLLLVVLATLTLSCKTKYLVSYTAGAKGTAYIDKHTPKRYDDTVEPAYELPSPYEFSIGTGITNSDTNVFHISHDTLKALILYSDTSTYESVKYIPDTSTCEEDLLRGYNVVSCQKLYDNSVHFMQGFVVYYDGIQYLDADKKPIKNIFIWVAITNTNNAHELKLQQ